jgi:lysine-N-methylase
MPPEIKVIVPHYYPDFHCLGGECPNNCCRDWATISIDKKTYNKYKDFALRSKEFSEKFAIAIKPASKPGGQIEYGKAAVIQLDKNLKCYFCGDDGLCEIHKKMGASYLSHTCRCYPRATRKIGKSYEAVLSLSCPEVAKKALFSKEPFSLTKIVMETNKNPLFASVPSLPSEYNAATKFALEIEELSIKILQAREFSISSRLFTIAKIWQELDCAKFHNDAENEIEAILGKTLKFEDFTAGIEEGRFEVFAKINMNTIYAGAVKYFTKFKEKLQEFTKTALNDEEDPRGDKIYTYVIKKSKKLWETFLCENSLILENYLVNTLFIKDFPFLYVEHMSLFQHSFLLAERISIFRLFFGIYAMENEIVSEEQIIDIVSKIEKFFSDGLASMKRFRKSFHANGFKDIEHLVYFLE